MFCAECMRRGLETHLRDACPSCRSRFYRVLFRRRLDIVPSTSSVPPTASAPQARSVSVSSASSSCLTAVFQSVRSSPALPPTAPVRRSIVLSSPSASASSSATLSGEDSVRAPIAPRRTTMNDFSSLYLSPDWCPGATISVFM